MLQKHWIGLLLIDGDFEDDWKGEVKSKVEACDRMSGLGEDAFLDKELQKAEIAKCLRKLRQVVQYERKEMQQNFFRTYSGSSPIPRKTNASFSCLIFLWKYVCRHHRQPESLT